MLVSTTIPNLINGVSQQPFATRMSSQAEDQLNCLSSVVEGLKRRPATQHVAKVRDGQAGDCFTHFINRDVTERYVVLITNGDLQVFDLAGNQKTVAFPGGKTYLAATSPSKSFKCLTIADHTFVLNKTVKAAMSTELSPSRCPEAIVFVKQANYSTTYKVTINGGSWIHTTGTGSETSGQVCNDFHSADDKNCPLSTSRIATGLANQINAHLGAYGFTVQVVKSTIWIKKTNTSDFTISVEDSRGNTQMTLAKDKVQVFSNLPTVAPAGFVCEVVGDATSNFDNYYVKFVPTNATATFDEGLWEETVKPGIPWKLDAATMPHVLVREANGTFTFKVAEWGNRTAGDADSAPDPSFIGNYVHDVFFWHNRLGFLADDNCIMTRAAEYFEWFPKTVTTVTDADPIDQNASHTKVSVLYHAVPWNEELLIFSDQTQFALDLGSDNLLSPKTCSIKTVTEFSGSTLAKPVGAGKNVFFVTDKGKFSGMREFFVELDTKTRDAADITAHVPQYLPANIFKLAVATNESLLVALSLDERNTAYVYKYYWSGDDKMQSSWSRWTFEGQVMNVEFIESDMYMLLQYSDALYLEKISIEPDHKDTDAPFEYSLDRKVKESSCTVTYDAVTKRTKFTLPYIIGTEEMWVVTRHSSPQATPPGSILVEAERGTNWIEVMGNYTSAKVFIGQPYEASYLFSTQVLREQAQGGGQSVVAEGRLQLRNWSLTYSKTGYFEVEVTPLYRDTNRFVFTGRTLGKGGNAVGELPIVSGTFRFPIMSKNDQVSILVRSKSFLPFHLLSAGWEGFYSIRSKRL